MANRPAAFTKADVTRAVSGARAAGMNVGEVRFLRDGSMVLALVGATEPAILDDDIDAKLAEFARK